MDTLQDTANETRGTSRTQLILQYTDRYLRETSANERQLAMDICQNYLDTTPEAARGLKFHIPDAVATVEELDKAHKANAQLIKRLMSNDVRMPVEIEEAWITALPDAYRLPLLRALSARLGLLAVPIPNGDCIGTNLGRFQIEVGEATQKIAEMLASNNCLGPEDLAMAPQALEELADVIAHATSLQQIIVDQVINPNAATKRLKAVQ